MVAADPWAMDILRIARRLALPDWAIGAGFLRPTPRGRRKIDQYQLRVTTKNWPARWPCVKVEAPT